MNFKVVWGVGMLSCDALSARRGGRTPIAVVDRTVQSRRGAGGEVDDTRMLSQVFLQPSTTLPFASADSSLSVSGDHVVEMLLRLGIGRSGTLLAGCQRRRSANRIDSVSAPTVVATRQDVSESRNQSSGWFFDPMMSRASHTGVGRSSLWRCFGGRQHWDGIKHRASAQGWMRLRFNRKRNRNFILIVEANADRG